MKKPKKLKRLDLLKGCELTIETKAQREQAQRIANGRNCCGRIYDCWCIKTCIFQADESVEDRFKKAGDDCIISWSFIYRKYLPAKYKGNNNHQVLAQKLIHAMGYRKEGEK